METTTVELVHTSTNQRFYKLSKKITKGIRTITGKIVDIPAELIESKEKYFKPEYKEICPVGGADIICISDATTHYERLVFVGMTYNEGDFGRTKIQIDGHLTFLSHGGSIKSMKPDLVYIRRLCMLNNLNMEVVSKN